MRIRSVVGIAALAVIFHVCGVGNAESASPPLPAPTILWGNVSHDTYSDGSETNWLDVRIQGTGNPFPELTVSVTGPNGFGYVFGPGDVYTTTDNIGLSHSFPSLEPGLYRFAVSDTQGRQSVRFDTHGGARTMEVPDVATIRYARRADGRYRFTWAPLREARTYYYRIRIAEAGGAVVYTSAAKFSNWEDVPAGVLTDGATYQCWVEAFDGPNADLFFNASHGAPLTFVPAASDYEEDRIFWSYWGADNRVEADGSELLELVVGVPDASTVTLAEVFGPEGFHYVFDLTADRLGTGELWKTLPGLGTPGLYRLHLVANGVDHEAFDTLTAAATHPAPAAATYQAEGLSNGNIRFSWAGVDQPGAVYYRVMVNDTATGANFYTARANQTFVGVNPSAFGSVVNKRWRVEVHDSPSFQTLRNRRNGPWVPLVVAPYDGGQPTLANVQMRRRVNTDGSEQSDLWFQASDADGSVAKLLVQGPDGYVRDLLVDGYLYLGNGYQGQQLLENWSPARGLYTFTAVDDQGKARVLHDLQPAPLDIPAVDYRSIRVETLESGDLSVTWAPPYSDAPLWYSVEFHTLADHNGDGKLDEAFTRYFLQQTSLTVPAGSLPAEPLVLRVQWRDGGTWWTVNNRRDSVVLGYEGPGFDYGQLFDADGDGYANNADGDDADPSVYPFAPPSYAIADYLPLRPWNVGQRGVYEGIPGVPGVREATVEGQERVNGHTTWRVRFDKVHVPGGGGEVPYTVRSWEILDDAGWSAAAASDPYGNQTVYEPPMMVLSSNPAWGETHERVFGDTRVRYTLVGERLVTTPGYQGRTLLIRLEVLGPSAYTEHWYFAPALGLVQSTTFGTQGGYSMGAATLTSLVPPPDTDGDGLFDGEEVYAYGTNPLVADTDGDGLSDGLEVHTHGTDPLDSDTDGDVMPDGWEILYGLNPLDSADAAADPDGDGLTNLEEYQHGTDPRVSQAAGLPGVFRLLLP